MKFLSVAFDLVAPVKLYHINSTGHLSHSWRLYYDATVPYMGKTHLPYAIVGSVVAVLLVVLPLLLIILYPFRWFQKFLNLFPFRWYILRTFMDSFQGYYKDGTEPGTRDYRWAASLFFILRILLLLIGFSLSGVFYCMFAPFVLVLAALFLANFQPYKDNWKNYAYIDISICTALAINHVLVTGIEVGSIFISPLFFNIVNLSVAVVTATAYVTFIVFHWIRGRRNSLLELIVTIKARFAGYSTLQHNYS